LILSVAVAGPGAAGLKTTLIAQLAPTATEVPQVLVWEKGCTFGLESVMPVIESAMEPVFFTVTETSVLATFVAWLPNAIVGCDTVKLDNSP
jgi:hypothetical protein